MLNFALNHVTVARADYTQLLEIASTLGCIGVEVRNDLSQPLFDGMAPAAAGAMARDRGLRILSVAEVKRFDAWSGERRKEALELARTAAAAGAEAVSLIPRNDGSPPDGQEFAAGLVQSLRALQPILSDYGLGRSCRAPRLRDLHAAREAARGGRDPVPGCRQHIPDCP